ncbi:hypothetical protein C8Q76DRAFT_817548, partial [Earliella scabrosa]
RFKQQKYYDHLVQFIKLVRQCLQFELTVEEVEDIRSGFISWVQTYETYYYQMNPERLPAVPLTIHALLHIADSIIQAGPVWAAWAFPMERYCGALQPAIANRRFPYASLNRHVLDRARLDQIKLRYGQAVKTELRLSPPRALTSGTSITGYDTCVLLPARRAVVLERGPRDKLVSALGTRFDTLTAADLRRGLPLEVQEWAKVRILPDGDTIRTSSLDAGSQDGRDASYVRYELLVDTNRRYRNRPIQLVKRTFYGQLQHILQFTLSADASCGLLTPTPLVFAVIQACKIEQSDDALDIHYYTRLGSLDYVDITTIQCVVGRIKDRGRYAIIDRSGTLSRALYIGEAGMQDGDG